MRMLGNKASIAVFRWDLVYLAAQLLADNRPGVSDLAVSIKDMLVKLNDVRDAWENAEDESIIATAIVTKRDRHRDSVVVELGGVARATDKKIYGTLFGSRSPSAVARLGIQEESKEVARVLGEIGALDAANPLRAAYEHELTDAEAAVKAAVLQTNDAITALAVQRSQVARSKVAADELRLSTHGSLTTLLKDKGEADSFFRPTSVAPGDEAAPDAAPAPPAPEAPAAPPPTGGG